MSYLLFGVIWILCLICGLLITSIRHSYGILKIDKSDPEKDSYLFEIDDLDEIEKVRWVRLKIVKIENKQP